MNKRLSFFGRSLVFFIPISGNHRTQLYFTTINIIFNRCVKATFSKLIES